MLEYRLPNVSMGLCYCLPNTLKCFGSSLLYLQPSPIHSDQIPKSSNTFPPISKRSRRIKRLNVKSLPVTRVVSYR